MCCWKKSAEDSAVNRLHPWYSYREELRVLLDIAETGAGATSIDRRSIRRITLSTWDLMESRIAEQAVTEHALPPLYLSPR